MRALLHMALLAFLLLVCAPAARAQVTDLSSDRIDIRYSFEGADLILFGTIGDANLDRNSAYEVIVVVRGPEIPTTVRQKARVNGIWVNADSVHFPAAPGYYAVASNRPMDRIAAADIYTQAGIGFDNLRLAIDDASISTSKRLDYMAALKRIRTAEGLYREEQDRVIMRPQGLFRTNIRMPATVPVGDYVVETFILQAGMIAGRHKLTLPVNKAGFERAVYNFAHDYPAFYGLLAIVVALCAGWLAGVMGKGKG